MHTYCHPSQGYLHHRKSVCIHRECVSCALNHLWGCIVFPLLPLFCPHSEPYLMAFILLQREFRLKITICYSAQPFAMAGSGCQSSDIIRMMTNKPFEIPEAPGQRAPYFSTELCDPTDSTGCLLMKTEWNVLFFSISPSFLATRQPVLLQISTNSFNWLNFKAPPCLLNSVSTKH